MEGYMNILPDEKESLPSFCLLKKCIANKGNIPELLTGTTSSARWWPCDAGTELHGTLACGGSSAHRRSRRETPRLLCEKVPSVYQASSCFHDKIMNSSTTACHNLDIILITMIMPNKRFNINNWYVQI